MQVSDIRDHRALQAWLEALPQNTETEKAEAERWAVTIAHRAAMRALPVFWGWKTNHSEEPLVQADLSILYLSLVTSLSESLESSKLKSMAAVPRSLLKARNNTYGKLAEKGSRFTEAAMKARLSASFLPLGIDETIPNLAPYEARAAFSVAISEEVLEIVGAYQDHRFKNVREDCYALQNGKDLGRQALWKYDSNFTQLWVDTKSGILAQGEGWDFWIDWYENALNGYPQDHDLLTKIAMIGYKDWDIGGDHVNSLIQQIVSEHKKIPTTVLAPLTEATVRRVQSSIQDNGVTLALQLGALVEVADREIERIRSINSIEPDTRDGLLAILKKLREAATEILDLLPDSGAPSEATSEQIANWGAVLKEQAAHWNVEAKKFVAGKPADDRVVLTGRIVLAATVTGSLTLMGLGTFAAIAGGAILLKDKLDVSKAINSIRSGTPPL